MISGVLGLVVASTLMTIDPWIPLLLTLGSTPLTALLVSFMPETLLAEEVSLDGRASAADDETGPLQGADVSSAETPALGRAAKGHAAHLLRSMLAALRLPLRQPSLLLLLSNYLIQAQFGVGDTSILVQYLSMRFQYTLARAALLLAACGSASVLMLVVLPAASRALAARSQAPTTQSPTAGSGPGEARGGEDEAVPAQSDSRSLSPFNRDRVLACASIAVAAVSSVLMGTGDLRLVVGGMLFGALGDGWGALVRSMATAFVPAEYNSRLAGLINMTDTVGGIIAGPSMALFFEMGLRRRGVWFGLPYFWLAFLAVWAFVALCFVRDPTAKKALDEEGSTEESQGLVDATVI